jgi:hypothetical protein
MGGAFDANIALYSGQAVLEVITGRRPIGKSLFDGWMALVGQESTP